MILKKVAARLVPIILFFLSVSVPPVPVAAQSKKLADLYRTGRVRLVVDMTIDTKALPEDSQLGMAADLTVDHQGNIYVLDAQACDIKKFDRKGKFLKALGRKGQGPGEFEAPSRLAVSGEKLIVYDSGNARLSCLGTDGSFITNIARTSDLEIVNDIKGLPDGGFVMEDVKYNYDRMDKPQDFRICVKGPGPGPEKDIYKRSILRTILVRLPQNAVTGYTQPYCPNIYWSVSPNGRILIGFSDKYELEIHDPATGRMSVISRPWKPVGITAEDRKRVMDSMVLQENNSTILNAIRKSIKFPDHKPSFDDVLFDPEGNILVHPITRGQAFVYDTFLSDGTFISRVEFFSASPRLEGYKKCVADGAIFIIRADTDGNYAIERWRITE